jgi:hypothetical protein
MEKEKNEDHGLKSNLRRDNKSLMISNSRLHQERDRVALAACGSPIAPQQNIVDKTTTRKYNKKNKK